MGVKLVSSGGGSVEINPPATASNFTATMPAGTGNVVVNGVNGVLVSATAVASTSGTSIDFTGIPSWVRRVTVMFSGVSTNGSSNYLVQIGSGSFNTSGYASSSVRADGGGNGYSSSTAGFVISAVASSASVSGAMTLNGVSSVLWAASHSLNMGSQITVGGGTSGTLSSALDRVRITTVNGTDTFDAGTINIMYE